MLKYIFYFILLLFWFAGCAQTAKKNAKSNKSIEIMNKLQNFDYEPLYQIRVESIYSYEVRINDIVVIRKFNDYMNNHIANINQAIIEKGKQDIQINIFPRYLPSKEQKNNLEQGVSFNLQIEETSWNQGNLNEAKTIVNYEMPRLDNSNKKIDFTQMESFIDKLSFNAEVPYKLLDWRTSKVFKRDDSLNIKPKVLAFYNRLKNDFENQYGKEYMKLIEKGHFNLFQSSYYTKEEANQHLNSKVNWINKKKRVLTPIENYQLEIMGNGRLLSLRRIDGYNRGEGVLRRYYKKNGIEKVSVDEILLHMPKGSNDFEVIWHMGLVKGVNL